MATSALLLSSTLARGAMRRAAPSALKGLKPMSYAGVTHTLATPMAAQPSPASARAVAPPALPLKPRAAPAAALTPPQPVTLVVGGGLVGTYLATRLAAGGARVVLKTHAVDDADPSTRLCRAAGVAVVDDLGALSSALAPPPRALWPPRAAPDAAAVGAGAIDLVLVTTKTYDHAAVAAELARYPRLAPTLATVLCHNGYVLGSADAFARAPDAAPVLKALVPGGYSFARDDGADGAGGAAAPRLVVTNGDAPWGIVGGAVSATRRDAVARALSARGLCAAGGAAAHAADVKKFLVNSTANLLAVAADANCATLVSDPALVARMRALYAETDALLRAAPSHAGAFARARGGGADEEGLLPDAAALADAVVAGVASYGAHYPSSHKDFVDGKRIEIEALNGYVVALGEQLGMRVDAHRELIAEVDALVAARDARAAAGAASL